MNTEEVTKKDIEWMSDCSSRRGTLQNKLENDGMNASDAFNKASEMVAAKEGMPVDYFKSRIGVLANRAGKSKGDISIKDLYITWCMENNYVASPKQLAHFVGCTSSAFYYPKKCLEEIGYEFEDSEDGGQRVIARPLLEVEKRTYTESEVKDIVTDAVNAAIEKLT